MPQYPVLRISPQSVARVVPDAEKSEKKQKNT